MAKPLVGARNNYLRGRVLREPATSGPVRCRAYSGSSTGLETTLDPGFPGSGPSSVRWFKAGKAVRPGPRGPPLVPDSNHKKTSIRSGGCAITHCCSWSCVATIDIDSPWDRAIIGTNGNFGKIGIIGEDCHAGAYREVRWLSSFKCSGASYSRLISCELWTMWNMTVARSEVR
jgi:hypothetical protein